MRSNTSFEWRTAGGANITSDDKSVSSSGQFMPCIESGVLKYTSLSNGSIAVVRNSTLTAENFDASRCKRVWGGAVYATNGVINLPVSLSSKPTLLLFDFTDAYYDRYATFIVALTSTSSATSSHQLGQSSSGGRVHSYRFVVNNSSRKIEVASSQDVDGTYDAVANNVMRLSAIYELSMG